MSNQESAGPLPDDGTIHDLVESRGMLRVPGLEVER
jgi:hypothetical protein